MTNPARHLPHLRRSTQGSTVSTELITLPKIEVQTLLDLATSSMDYASGFWDTEECNAARAVAVRLGVDPIEVTPSNMAVHYGHEFATRSYRPDRCSWCNRTVDDGPHLVKVAP